jgi:hypothetical protein
MHTEPQGPWLRAAATTECPGCGHVVDAGWASCEWCDNSLNGEIPTARDDTPPRAATATHAAAPPAYLPAQPVIPTCLLAQPLRLSEPIGLLPQAVVFPDQLPDQLGVVSTPPIQVTFSEASLLDQLLLSNLPLHVVVPTMPTYIGTPATPAPVTPILVTPTPVTLPTLTPPALQEPVVRPGNMVTVRPPIWPTSSFGRISGPGR